MDKNLVIEKLRNAGIFGKGGAAYPTADKWQGVSEAEGDKKYIIVNSSEGEMGLFKDLYVWRNHMDKVFKGIDYGIKFLESYKTSSSATRANSKHKSRLLERIAATII